MAKSKEFKNLEEVLTEGVHVIELTPKEEYSESEGRYIKGTHRTGEVKSGKNMGKVYWLYNTNVPYRVDVNGEVKERKCGVIAFSPMDKKIFDQGQVKVEVKKLEWYNSVESPGKKFWNLSDIEAAGETPLVIGSEPYKFCKVVANIHPMDWEPKFGKSNSLPNGVKLMTPSDLKDIPTIDVEEDIDLKDIPF